VSYADLIDGDNDYVHVSPFTQPSKGAFLLEDLDDRHWRLAPNDWHAPGVLRIYLEIVGGETDVVVLCLFVRVLENAVCFYSFVGSFSGVARPDYCLGGCSILALRLLFP
jgi:hypothetical protein